MLIFLRAASVFTFFISNIHSSLLLNRMLVNFMFKIWKSIVKAKKIMFS